MDFANRSNGNTSSQRAANKSPLAACITAGLIAFGVGIPTLVINEKATAQNAMATVAKAPNATHAIGKPLVAFSGPNSRIVQPSFRRVTSSKEWEALWKQHTGLPSSEYYDKSARPRVNFDECMVIAVFSGSSIANDGVSALSVVERPDRLVVSYTNRYMQIGMPTQEQLKNPRGAFGMFVLPRSAKPVVMGEYVRDRKGSIPVFKERATLPATTPATSSPTTG